MKNNDLEMPEEVEKPQEYLIAQSPEDLTQVLESLLEKSRQDHAFASQGHYILYQFGSQKSLLKVDMSKHPYMFYYHDLFGRPITRSVKNTIVRFLWEKCGLKEQYSEELEDD